MDEPQLLSRRRFLKRTFAFSAATMLGGCGSGIRGIDGSPDAVSGGVTHYLMVGDWGWNGSLDAQNQVAKAMQKYVAAHDFSTDALWMLGDNFYGDLTGGVSSTRWSTQFEQTYPQSVFDCPAFAVMGNHDYQNAPESKVDAELAYAATGKSRFTMPGTFYRFTFPAKDPTVTFLALDSNMPNEPSQPIPPDPSYFTLSDAERKDQLNWLNENIRIPLETPFLVVIGHHPLYSNGPHGDNKTLIRDWDPLFRLYKPHLYIAGHDHDLQHLELEGHPTSFLTSGGGGASLGQLSYNGRGPFADEVYGFTHLQVRPDLMIVRHLDVNGNLLHKFTKTPEGVVAILK